MVYLLGLLVCGVCVYTTVHCMNYSLKCTVMWLYDYVAVCMCVCMGVPGAAEQCVDWHAFVC